MTECTLHPAKTCHIDKAYLACSLKNIKTKRRTEKSLHYTEEELKRIELPALLLVGAGEIIYNPKKAVNRAQRLMPNLTAEIIPHVGHTLNMEQPEIINSRVLAYKPWPENRGLGTTGVIFTFDHFSAECK